MDITSLRNNDRFDFDILKSKIEKSYKQISISRRMRKFYRRRYQLFNKFDYGILMDNESWYSVTPEKTAYHIARKCFELLKCKSDNLVLDAFCGAGGNAIQFAKYFDHVISSDKDWVKLQCAQHNSNVYNVNNKVSFILQDFFHLHDSLDFFKNKIDLIFLSPPWGGVIYLSSIINFFFFFLTFFYKRLIIFMLSRVICQNSHWIVLRYFCIALTN
jgi:tRNA/tmRNA/rRNA uracil-C5-methylase (TrmA/RlmC/RlmD family)